MLGFQIMVMRVIRKVLVFADEARLIKDAAEHITSATELLLTGDHSVDAEDAGVLNGTFYMMQHFFFRRRLLRHRRRWEQVC